MATQMPAEVSVHEARKKLGDFVLAAKLADKTTVLTYHGKAAALIVPIPTPEGEQAHV